MGIDYTRKRGFNFIQIGNKDRPEVCYHIDGSGTSPTEWLVLQQHNSKLRFSITYRPLEERVEELQLQDASLSWKITYDPRTREYYADQPLIAEEIIKLIELGLKKFVDAKEKYGIIEKIQQYDIGARAKAVLSNL